MKFKNYEEMKAVLQDQSVLCDMLLKEKQKLIHLKEELKLTKERVENLETDLFTIIPRKIEFIQDNINKDD